MLKINSQSVITYVAILALVTACADGSNGKKVRLPLRSTQTKAQAGNGQGTQPNTAPEINVPAGEAAKQANYEKASADLDSGTVIHIAEMPAGTYVVESIATELRISKMKGSEQTFFGILQTFTKSDDKNLAPGQTLSYGDAGNELDAGVILNFGATFDLAITNGAASVKNVQSNGITMKANLADPTKIQDATTFAGQGKISNLDLILSADDASQTLLTSKSASSSLGLQIESKIMKLSDTRIRIMTTVYKDAQKQTARNLFVTYTVTPAQKASDAGTGDATKQTATQETAQDTSQVSTQNPFDQVTFTQTDANNNTVKVTTDSSANVDIRTSGDTSATDSVDVMDAQIGGAIQN